MARRLVLSLSGQISRIPQVGCLRAQLSSRCLTLLPLAWMSLGAVDFVRLLAKSFSHLVALVWDKAVVLPRGVDTGRCLWKTLPASAGLLGRGVSLMRSP